MDVGRIIAVACRRDILDDVGRSWLLLITSKKVERQAVADAAVQ